MAATLPKGAIAVELAPHAAQWRLMELFNNPANKETYARCGRRFGKSFAAAVCAVKFLLENPKSPHYVSLGTPNPPASAVCLVGPDFQRAKRVWDEMLHLFEPVIKHKKETDLSIIFRGGGTVNVFSGENIASIRGAGYDIVILDEAVGLSEAAISADVMPTLADRAGRLWAISSPKFGKRNWFNRRCLEAESGAIDGVVGFHASTFDNPNIDPGWLKREIGRRDSQTVKEEFYAEILDTSSNWLDPSLIGLLDADQIPGNTLNAIIIDSAWAKPEIIEKESRRRKDATVIAVLGQDMLGNVYCLDGTWDKELQPESAFEIIDGYLRQYNALWLLKERVADDPFASMWLSFKNRHGSPNVGLVLPSRKAGWKAQQIRYWAGQLLERGKFFMANGNPLYPHLVEECEKYSETDSKRDRCADDVLTAMSDILNPGVWRGQWEHLAVDRAIEPVDVFRLKTALDGINQTPLRSRYSIV